MTDDGLQSAASVKPLMSVQIVAVVLAIVFGAVIALVLGHRPDLAEGLVALPVSFSLKASFFVLVLLSSIFGLRVSAAAGQERGANDGLFVLAIVAIISAVIIETALVPAHAILADFVAAKPALAMGCVTSFGFIGSAVLVALLRRHRLLAPQKAAAWTGLAAAAAGALGYSVYCPSASPTFVLVAYGAPCLLVSCITALVAPRFLKR